MQSQGHTQDPTAGDSLPMHGSGELDLGPLAWIVEEVRKTVDGAIKQTRRFALELVDNPASDLVAVDVYTMRAAKQQMHQASGALEMVGLSSVAGFLQCMESVMQRYIQKPELCTENAVLVLERSSFAVLEYLDVLLSGKMVSTAALFPQYREVQALLGNDKVHPADLWECPEHVLTAVPLSDTVPAVAYGADTRSALEQAVLRVVKTADTQAAAQLRSISLGLMQSEAGSAAVFWGVAAGFFDALAHQRLRSDVYVKRMSSRVLLQYSAFTKGEKEVAPRLLRDMLFFCMQAGSAPHAPAALRAVCDAMGQPVGVPLDYDEPRFGRYDPALLALARKRIATAAETWSALVGGDKGKIKAAVDQFGLVCDALQRLQPGSGSLVKALNRVMQQLVQRGAVPDTAVAMEVATAVLYLQAVFSSQDFAVAQTEAHADVLAQRLLQALERDTPQPLESWMEELYRKASDAQTMGSVVGELRGTLDETEKVLDQYFRQPAHVSQLSPVIGHLSQMRGVLSVLGLDQAALAMVRMREVVEQLLHGTVSATAQAQLFDRLGNSLGALGFLIDMLSYQRAMARKLFVYDEQKGELQLLMGRAKPLAPSVAQPAVASPLAPALAPTLQVRSDPQESVDPRVSSDAQGNVPAMDGLEALPLRSTLEEEAQMALAATPALPLQDGASDATASVQAEPAEPASRAVPNPLEAPNAGTAMAFAGEGCGGVHEDMDEAVDAELRSIFLEEAREVVEAGKTALRVLAEQPASLTEQATLRRAFHTLKGSSRMVGLHAFGEAAWAFEQMLNAWVAEQKPMPDDMQGLSQQAMHAFAGWVDAIEAGGGHPWRAAPFQASADAMRVQAVWVPLDLGALDATAQDHHDVHTEVEEGVNAPTLQAVMSDDVVVEQACESMQDEATNPVAMPDGVPEGVQVDAERHAVLDNVEQPVDLAGLGMAVDLPAADAMDFSALEAALQAAVPATASVPPLDLTMLAEGEDAASVAPTPAVPMGEGPLLLDDRITVEPPAWDVSGSVAEGVLGSAVESLDSSTETSSAATLGAEGAVQGPACEDAESSQDEDSGMRQIGPLRISEALFNVYLGEAQEWSQQLQVALQDWQATPGAAQPEAAAVCAHGLAGSSATVGFHALSDFARTLEHALQHVQPMGGDLPPVVLQTLASAAEEIVALLHQFAAGFLRVPQARLMQALHAVLTLERTEPEAPLQGSAQAVAASAEPASVPVTGLERGFSVPPAATPSAPAPRSDGMDVQDIIDPDLFPIFEEEAVELLPTLGAAMRQWAQQPQDLAPRSTVLRALHTLKGSARLAGAMRLGEMAHRLESAMEALDAQTATSVEVDPLLEQVDALQANFDRLRLVGADAAEPLVVDAGAGSGTARTPEPAVPGVPAAARPQGTPVRSQAQQTVRVRSQLLDRLINEAGEVLIARSRLDARMTVVHNALADLGGNLERLRQQLRDLEVQAESQMQSRKAYSRDAGGDFDPLEFDRFTRVQELTRMMAESVNDVATLQRHLQREVTGAEDDLVAQGRQARELQRGLLHTRMVEFDSVAERLYAVVRNAAKETGKQVKLDIHGGTIEVDRGVLERMAPAFEHLLRNCVDHGIEAPQDRTAAGKPAQGTIAVQVQQEGNDVAVAFRDDGFGLHVDRIRAKALEQGLVQADEEVDGARAAELIFMPGFSTATTVTGLSGRGIGMDVLRSEVQSLGGRIETTTTLGQGSCFRMVLPLTTAVTQVLMVRVGEFSVGVPANLVETVRRLQTDEMDEAYRSGSLRDGSVSLPFYWAGAVWQQSARSTEEAVARTRPVLMLRSAAQRIALHVDEVLGNQEVVIKHLGPQMARLPGLTGMSVLPSGAVVLIYNPVALTSVYADRIRALGAQGQGGLGEAGAAGAQGPADLLPLLGGGGPSQVPLVMVVDDSITVRRVTQRLLQREGYRVVMAADGVQALEKLEGELPCVVLSDIEMPRMDGFDLARQIRADERLKALPLVMITSRIADKHREHALSLGANHYLGKPYRDEELMHLVRHYAGQMQQATGAAASAET